VRTLKSTTQLLKDSFDWVGMAGLNRDDAVLLNLQNLYRALYVVILTLRPCKDTIFWVGQYWTNFNDPSCWYPTEI